MPPGITVRPIRNIAGAEDFCEVFLDNVRVPPSALLGEEGMGWSYGKVLLDRERGVTAATTTRLAQQLRGARKVAAETMLGGRSLLDDPRVADRLAQRADAAVAAVASPPLADALRGHRVAG